jgi:hypothetical protein
LSGFAFRVRNTERITTKLRIGYGKKMKNQNLKRFVRVGAGPALGGAKNVKVRIREVFTSIESVVTFAKFKKLEQAGQIVPLAFIPKEKR